jgi:two-component system NtrC family response regulator
MADAAEITAEDLELDEVAVEEMPFALREVRELAELQAVQRALSFGDNNLSRTAELLGITRPTLYNLMKKYGLSN